MNITVSIFAFLIALSASAQQTSSMTTPSKGQSGLSVGLNYFNMNEATIKSNFKSGSYSSDSESNFYGQGVGMPGIDIGFNSTPYSGIGFSAKLLYFEKEVENQKTGLLIPQVNMTMGMTPMLIGYLGVNYSEFTQPTGMKSDQRFDLGAQAGVGFRLTNAVTFNMGYLLLRQKYEYSGPGYTASTSISYGGFHSSLAYTF